MSRKRLGRRERLKVKVDRRRCAEFDKRLKLANGTHIRLIYDDTRGIGGLPSIRGGRAQSATFYRKGGIRPIGAQV